jgi:hypothetical protein
LSPGIIDGVQSDLRMTNSTQKKRDLNVTRHVRS